MDKGAAQSACSLAKITYPKANIRATPQIFKTLQYKENASNKKT
jgi:hypothetical protein